MRDLWGYIPNIVVGLGAQRFQYACQYR